ncbi:unnamed protein product, partial [Protopolystoma xenopodis]
MSLSPDHFATVSREVQVTWLLYLPSLQTPATSTRTPNCLWYQRSPGGYLAPLGEQITRAGLD